MIRIAMTSRAFLVRRLCGKWYVLLIFLLFWAQFVASKAAWVVIAAYVGIMAVASAVSSAERLPALSRSLSDIRGRRTPFFAEAANHRYVWVLLLSVPIVFVVAVLAGRLVLFPVLGEGSEPIATAGSLVIMAAGIISSGYLAFRRDARRSYEAARRGERPLVLYLRTFSNDATLVTGDIGRVGFVSKLDKLFGTGFSVERTIYRAVNVHGLTGVAIGAPGERLPPLGFYRLYFSNDEWQREVSALIAQATVILLNSSPTHWVHWELNEIVRQRAVAKLIILTHAPTSRQRVANLDFAFSALGRRERFEAHNDRFVMGAARLDRQEPVLIEGYTDDLFAYMDATSAGIASLETT